MNAIEFPPEMRMQIVQWAQHLLESEGATVTWPGDGHEWLTLAELIRRVRAGMPEPKLSVECLRSRVGRAACPEFPRQLHPTGRLKALVATPELIRFLTLPAQPGEAL